MKKINLFSIFKYSLKIIKTIKNKTVAIGTNMQDIININLSENFMCTISFKFN